MKNTTPKNPEKTYALVTGASNGIGKAIAEECAKRGFNVLLVALPEPKLDAVRNELAAKYPQQEFHSLGKDLMQKNSPLEIYHWCQDKGFVVDKLINNAGLGNAGSFESRGSDFYYGQMQLNMVSLVMLTHHFLPDLKALPKAYILNVASMAAFYDIPYKIIYSASKGFVYSFSRALREEINQSNIGITVLCPAAVPTKPEVIKRDEEMGKVAKWSRQTPEYVAAYSIDRMLRGKAVAIPGSMPKIYKTIGRIFPYNLKLRILTNLFRRQMNADKVETMEAETVIKTAPAPIQKAE